MCKHLHINIKKNNGAKEYFTVIMKYNNIKIFNEMIKIFKKVLQIKGRQLKVTLRVSSKDKHRGGISRGAGKEVH